MSAMRDVLIDLETGDVVPDVVRHGDFYVNVHSGEIVGIVEPKPKFRVEDDDSAEWVMSKLFDAEAEHAALEARKRTLIENIESMQADVARRVEWLRLRFGAELEAYAAEKLKDARTRTLKTPFGKLSFRRLKPRLVVEDESYAIAWAKSAKPEAVRVTEKFLVSACDITDEIPGTRVEPEQDRFKIDTGVGE